MRFLTTPRPAECGSCSACCKLLAIDAETATHEPLVKAQNQWCPHARKGCGCSIYDQRPDVCRDFACVWLTSSEHAPELRPDKIHGMLASTTDGRHLVLHEDPGYPGEAHRALRPMLDKWIADGTRYYVLVNGTKVRKFYGNPSLLPTATKMLDEVKVKS